MKKILVVDDNKDIVNLLKGRLASKNFEVISACDGKEGVEMVKSRLPDLVIFDIMMPNMSGGDAVKELHEDPKTADIPILFLTAVISGESAEEEKGINVGSKFYPVIAKPFESEHLLDCVNKILNEE